MIAHFRSMASYTAWANRRLYADAAALPDDKVHRDVGIYFKSLFGTLVHLLQTDRAWTFILRGGNLDDMKLPPPPGTMIDLRAARIAQDDAFAVWIGELDETWCARPFAFVSGLGSWKGLTYTGTNASALSHVLNHQTHHRGQAHAALTLLGVSEPAALDIVVKGFLQE